VLSIDSAHSVLDDRRLLRNEVENGSLL
jgi:hypothetical protein